MQVEVEKRVDLKGIDVYYLGLLFDFAENEEKTFETLKRFLAQYPPETKGDAIQAARTYVIIIAAKQKQFAEAVQTFEAWQKGEPLVESQRPAIEKSLAVSFYKDGKYEEAIKYAQSGFDNLKALEAKALAERRSKMEVYGNLVEISAELRQSFARSKQREFGVVRSSMLQELAKFIY